jgi:chromosome segregation ATPase
MAQAERDAMKAAGLDVPLAAYREATAKFLPPLEAFLQQLGEPLTELIGTVRAVESGALARIAEEEQIAGAAVTRAEEATAERDQAVRERTTAQQEAKQAKEATLLAQRLQRDAERERDRDVDAAWAKLVESESQRAAAEAKATEVGANLTAQIARYDKIAEQNDILRESNKKLTKANTALETSLKTAQDERAAAVTLADQRAQDLAAAGEAKAAAEAALETLRAELDRVRADLATAQQATSDRQARLDTEKQRADGLATELATAAAAAEQHRADLAAARGELEQTRAALTAEQTVTAGLRTDLARAEARAATVEELRSLLGRDDPAPPAP